MQSLGNTGIKAMSRILSIFNGIVFTVDDARRKRKEDQSHHLQNLMRSQANLVKPGYVHTFLNSAVFPYGGWWLYVDTLEQDWWIEHGGLYKIWPLKIMKLFPCGYLPMIENYDLWKEAFARFYPRATRKRPHNQGMAMVRVECTSYGSLIDVRHL